MFLLRTVTIIPYNLRSQTFTTGLALAGRGALGTNDILSCSLEFLRLCAVSKGKAEHSSAGQVWISGASTLPSRVVDLR